MEAVGSIPTPATNDFYRLSVTDGLFLPHFRAHCVCRTVPCFATARDAKSLYDERTIFKVNWKCIILPSGTIPDGSQLMDRLTIN